MEIKGQLKHSLSKLEQLLKNLINHSRHKKIADLNSACFENPISTAKVTIMSEANLASEHSELSALLSRGHYSTRPSLNT